MPPTDETLPSPKIKSRRKVVLLLPPLIWVAAALQGGFFWTPEATGFWSPDTSLYLFELGLSAAIVVALRGMRLMASLVLSANFLIGWLIFVLIAMAKTGVGL